MGRISKWSNLYTKQGKLIAKAPIKNLFNNFSVEKPNGIYIPKRHRRKRTA